MQISLPKEAIESDKRVAIVPSTVKKLIAKGLKFIIESDLGTNTGFSDEDYVKAGAVVHPDRKQLFSSADMIIRINKPPIEDVRYMQKGAILISFLEPYNSKDLIKELLHNGVSAISLEMIPNTTRAQKFNVLNSQSSLTGYASIILAAEKSGKVFPMMMTPSGTIKAAKVFIIGASIAGMQAAATAKRLGAVVDVYDIRPSVSDQVKSIGARFIRIETKENQEADSGYARPLSMEELIIQQQVLSSACKTSDIIITAVQTLGKKAPLLITKEMINGMKKGTVVIDLAVDSGGNVEGVAKDQETNVNGVKIIGFRNIISKVALDASEMFSSNISSLVEEIWDEKSHAFVLNHDNDILKSALITHKGNIVNPKFQ